MNKVMTIVGIVLFVLVLILAGTQSSTPTSWTPTYERASSDPLGSEIVFEHLRRTAQAGIDIVYVWPFPEHETSDDADDDADTTSASPEADSAVVEEASFPLELVDSAVYVVVTAEWNPESEALDGIAGWVHRGGTLFVATEGLSRGAAGMFDIHVESQGPVDGFRVVGRSASARRVRFDSLPSAVRSRSAARPYHDGMYDTIAANNAGEPVLMRRSYGSGTVIVCSMPRLLTNVGLLQAPSMQASTLVLDQIDRHRPIVWDEYFKIDHEREPRPGGRSALRTYPPLQWALGVCIVAALLYVVVYSRRIQRPIPVIDVEKNTSADFIDTVAAAHEARRDAPAMVEAMIGLFNDHVTNDLHVERLDTADALAAAIATAGGGSADACLAVLRHVERLRQSAMISEDDMVELHQTLQTYYRSVAQ